MARTIFTIVENQIYIIIEIIIEKNITDNFMAD